MASSNQNPAQNAPQKKHIFLNYFLPIIVGAVGLVGGWYLNAYMMPPNKDAKELIKTQAEQVQATREGFNKLADAIQRNNMADIVNNANMVGVQLNGLGSTTNRFLAEYKLPVVKGDSVKKVVVVPNPINGDTGNKVVNPPSPVVPLSTEFKIKVGDRNTYKIDEANFLAIVAEDEDTGQLRSVFNGSQNHLMVIGSISFLIPIKGVQKKLLYQGKDESKANYVFRILDPVK
jgi:hypothetical protein